MYIHEAILATQSKESRMPFIRRKCWPYNGLTLNGYKIRATVAPGGCVAYSLDLPPEKWVPRPDELVADDWEPCL